MVLTKSHPVPKCPSLQNIFLLCSKSGGDPSDPSDGHLDRDKPTTGTKINPMPTCVDGATKNDQTTTCRAVTFWNVKFGHNFMYYKGNSLMYVRNMVIISLLRDIFQLR